MARKNKKAAYDEQEDSITDDGKHVIVKRSIMERGKLDEDFWERIDLVMSEALDGLSYVETEDVWIRITRNSLKSNPKIEFNLELIGSRKLTEEEFRDNNEALENLHLQQARRDVKRLLKEFPQLREEL